MDEFKSISGCQIITHLGEILKKTPFSYHIYKADVNKG